MRITLFYYMKSKWNINSFLERRPSAQSIAKVLHGYESSTSRHQEKHSIPITQITISNTFDNPNRKKPIKLVTPNLRYKPTQHKAAYDTPHKPPSTNIITASHTNIITASHSNANYTQLLLEKDKRISLLANENKKLKMENLKLIDEKNDTSRVLKEFAHSMGKIIESLLIQKNEANQSKAKHAQSYSTVISESSHAEKPLECVAKMRSIDTSSFLSNMSKISVTSRKDHERGEGMCGIKKSVKSMLKESSQTKMMVQNALEEIQTLVKS